MDATWLCYLSTLCLSTWNPSTMESPSIFSSFPFGVQSLFRLLFVNTFRPSLSLALLLSISFLEWIHLPQILSPLADKIYLQNNYFRDKYPKNLYYQSNFNIISLFLLFPCNQSYFNKNKPPIIEIHLINFNC